MRPVKLTLSAFCSYSGETVVEFDKLGTTGLYLITGDTGAGKTTIFDAVSYALFGTVSGSARGTLRSQYADHDTPTFVELTFVYGEKEYTVRRDLPYEYEHIKEFKNGKQETKIKKIQAAHILYLPNETAPLTKETLVNDKIKEILGGIADKQYKQIAMIAQGEFRKLLETKSEARRDIFRQLFDTTKFAALQEKLKEKAKDAEQRYAHLQASVRRSIESILLTDEDAAVKQYFVHPDDVLPVLQTHIDRDSTEQKHIQENLDIINRDLAGVNQSIGRINKIEKMRKEHADAVQQFADKQLVLASVQKAFDEQDAKKPEVKDLSDRITLARDKLTEYEVLDNAQGEQKKDIDNLKILRQQAADSNKQSADLQTALNEKQSEIEHIGNAEAGIQKANGVIQAIQTQRAAKEKELAELNENIRKFNEFTDRYRCKQDEYSKQKESAQQKQTEYDIQYQRYYDDMAGILSAEKLNENEPCPVCGSLEHPCPATKNADTPDKKAVDSAKNVAEQEKTKAEKLSNEAAKLKGQIDAIAPLVINADETRNRLADAAAALLQQENQLKTELDTLRHKSQRKVQLEDEIKTDNVHIDTLKTQIADIKTKITALETNIANRQETIGKLKQELRFAGRKQAEEAINVDENNKYKLETDFQRAEKALKKCKDEMTELAGQINALAQQTAGTDTADLAVEIDKQTQLESQRHNADERNLHIAKRLEKNKTSYAQLQEALPKLKESEGYWADVKALHDTANAKISGSRIDLETYILSHYFDRILIRASQRLLKMSGGQYDLKRTDESKGMQKVGLDINVFDYYNGTERPGSTLSGGEGFLASLALALGLADEIQASAGGIKIDSLFIDEGFGLLDTETLHQAVQTLTQLSNDRLVGIISHVEELKNAVDKKIAVKKKKNSREGSSCSIEV